MTKTEAIRVLERDLRLRGKPPELWAALDVLRPAKRGAAKPKPVVFTKSKAVVGFGQLYGYLGRAFSRERDVAAWQRDQYLDTFGARGSEERREQERRLMALPHYPQFSYEFRSAKDAKLLTLQAVDSMAATAFVEPAAQEIAA